MSDDKHKSGLARFFWKLDPVGRFLLPDSISKKPIESADWINKQGHAVAKRDPIIQFDRKSGVSSWSKETKKISDWAYDHPGDASLLVLGAVAGGGAAAGAGAGGGGTAAAGTAGAAGAGTAAGVGAGAGAAGIGSAIEAALPVVTVTGSTGGGAAGAVAAGAAAGAAGGAAAASNAGSSNGKSDGLNWQKYSRQLGSNMMQNGQSQEEKMLEQLARQGPPPSLGNGGNVGPIPVDQYRNSLTPATPNKVFG